MNAESARSLDVAVIGNEDLIQGLRLAGVSQYRIVDDVGDVRRIVREAFAELMKNHEVCIVVMMEGHKQYVEDLVAEGRESFTPIILEVPARHGTIYRDITDYYKSYVRKVIGFEVNI